MTEKHGEKLNLYSTHAYSHVPHLLQPNHPHGLQVKYKAVMKQYNLGPNGGILTACNLFATRFDQVSGSLLTCLVLNSVQLILYRLSQRVKNTPVSFFFLWIVLFSLIALFRRTRGARCLEQGGRDTIPCVRCPPHADMNLLLPDAGDGAFRKAA